AGAAAASGRPRARDSRRADAWPEGGQSSAQRSTARPKDVRRDDNRRRDSHHLHEGPARELRRSPSGLAAVRGPGRRVMATRTGQLYRRFGKRWLDTCLSGMLLVLVMPLVACIAVAIRMRLGSPVLFAQRRPGLRGSPFTLVKFRTIRQPGPGQ